MAGIYSLAGAVRALRAVVQSGRGDPHHIWETTIEPVVREEGWIYGDVPTNPKELLIFVDELLAAHQSDIDKAWRDY